MVISINNFEKRIIKNKLIKNLELKKKLQQDPSMDNTEHYNNKEKTEKEKEDLGEDLGELRANCSDCQDRGRNMSILDLCSYCYEHLMDTVEQCDECNYCEEHYNNEEKTKKEKEELKEDLGELRENCSDCQDRGRNMSILDLCSYCYEHLMDTMEQCDECNYCEDHR